MFHLVHKSDQMQHGNKSNVCVSFIIMNMLYVSFFAVENLDPDPDIGGQIWECKLLSIIREEMEQLLHLFFLLFLIIVTLTIL